MSETNRGFQRRGPEPNPQSTYQRALRNLLALQHRIAHTTDHSIRLHQHKKPRLAASCNKLRTKTSKTKGRQLFHCAQKKHTLQLLRRYNCELETELQSNIIKDVFLFPSQTLRREPYPTPISSIALFSRGDKKFRPCTRMRCIQVKLHLL
jgi:hypothetical protein